MNLTLSLLPNGNFLASTPAGRQSVIEPSVVGLQLLVSLLRAQPRPAPTPVAPPRTRAERRALHSNVHSNVRNASIQTYCPSDYSRVCHCGRPTPVLEPCLGCPGAFGAGKLRRFLVNGKEQLPSLEELGLSV